METQHLVLVASHDPGIQRAAEAFGRSHGVEVDYVASESDLAQALAEEPSLVVVDEDLADFQSGSVAQTSLSPRLVVVLGEDSTARPGSDALVRRPLDTAVFNATIRAQLEIRDLSVKLAVASGRDELTGLLTRRALRERFEEECRRSWRYKTPFTVVMMEIDRLTAINERFGEPVGDELLQRVAMRCLGALRDMDVLARWSGAEFAAILPETPLGHGLLVAARVRQLVTEVAVVRDEETVPLTVSLGVAGTSEKDMSDSEKLVRHAEQALRSAKENGRNGVFFHTPSGAVRFAEIGV